MPVIDLTSIEDNDENNTGSLTESNKTPPLDINGNEILITTDTKTMQAIAYKKPNDLICMKTKPDEIPLLQANQSTSSSRNFFPLEPSKCPILFANLTHNGCRMPPKEQLKFLTKYNRWMRYFRTYNGFRLFVQRNHLMDHAQALRNADRTFVQSTLLKWWNTMTPAEKEQYVQIADILHTKKSRKLHSSINNKNTNIMSTSTFTSMPIRENFEKSIAVDVNLNRNTEANVNTVHTPHNTTTIGRQFTNDTSDIAIRN